MNPSLSMCGDTFLLDPHRLGSTYTTFQTPLTTWHWIHYRMRTSHTGSTMVRHIVVSTTRRPEYGGGAGLFSMRGPFSPRFIGCIQPRTLFGSKMTRFFGMALKGGLNSQPQTIFCRATHLHQETPSTEGMGPSVSCLDRGTISVFSWATILSSHSIGFYRGVQHNPCVPIGGHSIPVITRPPALWIDQSSQCHHVCTALWSLTCSSDGRMPPSTGISLYAPSSAVLKIKSHALDDRTPAFLPCT